MKLLAITGATSGLGEQIASSALQSGYSVIGLARNAPTKDLGFPVEQGDVADYQQVRSFFTKLRNKNLWGVINAAGIASMNLTVTTPPETMARIVSVNLLGTMHCCVEGAKLLIRNKGGRIINFSSIAVPLALAGESVYASSKAGVETFTRCFAREVSGFGITANIVSPGPITTPLLGGVTQEQINAITARQIIQRQATPCDLWPIVNFLLSDSSTMISGDVLHVGGA